MWSRLITKQLFNGLHAQRIVRCQIYQWIQWNWRNSSAITYAISTYKHKHRSFIQLFMPKSPLQFNAAGMRICGIIDWLHWQLQRTRPYHFYSVWVFSASRVRCRNGNSMDHHWSADIADISETKLSGWSIQCAIAFDRTPNMIPIEYSFASSTYNNTKRGLISFCCCVYSFSL